MPDFFRRITKRSRPFERMREHSGRCNICGNDVAFFYEDEALYRESLFCAMCLTTSRYRSIARGILQAIWELTGLEAQSLADLSSVPEQPHLNIYDTQVPYYWETCSYPIPDLLSRCSWIDVFTSTYRPDETLGISLGAGTTNQNLERLTYPDDSFDIVITSDVMEHVRLDYLAHREIRRVLKPGGFYLFTVPHFRHVKETLTRVAIVDPSNPRRDRFLMEKEYHGDANSKDGRALSYRAYGTEIDDSLAALGFKVEYYRQDLPDTGILNTELFSCRLSTDKPRSAEHLVESVSPDRSSVPESSPAVAEKRDESQERSVHRQEIVRSSPASWTEVELRAAEVVRGKTGNDLTGHVLTRLNARPGVRMLSIGSTGLEVTFAQQARSAHIVGMDTRPELLELASQRANELQLDLPFELVDFNTVELPRNDFDLVLCHASLRNVVELERMVEQIKTSMRPQGEVIVVDVVARNGYRMWNETRDVIWAMWKTLPRRFRLNHTAYAAPRIDEEIWEADPSNQSLDCLRSEDLIAVLEQAFSRRFYVPYFSISRRFFDTMYGPNYVLQNPLDKALLNWIWELDLYYLGTEQLRPETFFGVYGAE